MLRSTSGALFELPSISGRGESGCQVKEGIEPMQTNLSLIMENARPQPNILPDSQSNELSDVSPNIPLPQLISSY